MASSVWLPWLVLAVEVTLRRRSRLPVVGLALLTALAIDGGHPGTEVQTVGAAGLYGLVRAFTLVGRERRERLLGLARMAAGMVAGGLLMAFVVIPVILASQGTSGAAARAGGNFSLPLEAIRTLLFPGWWGRPNEGNYLGPVNYVERTVYAGSIALLLAVLAVLIRRDWRAKAPFLVVGLVGLGVAFDYGPIHLGRRPPPPVGLGCQTAHAVLGAVRDRDARRVRPAGAAGPSGAATTRLAGAGCGSPACADRIRLAGAERRTRSALRSITSAPAANTTRSRSWP